MPTEATLTTSGHTTEFTLSTGARGPAGENDASVIYNQSATVVVDASGTDAQRGAALVTAYEAAKLLTPNGAALSHDNRAVVLLPDGKYMVSGTFELDADFVDLRALVPAKPSRRLPTDDDADANNLILELSTFRPQPVMIYTDGELINSVAQTADDVRLEGFTIAQISPFDAYIDLGVPEWGAFYIGDCDNSASIYQDMYFWCAACSYSVSGGVRAYQDFKGTWINCVANSCSFRIGYADLVAPTSTFSATMIDCEAGPFSFIGDYFPERKAEFNCIGATFIRCKGIGTHQGSNFPNGDCCFSGCTAVGVTIDSTSKFIDCEAGFNSFGIGVTNSGTFIRCRAGSMSFGASGTRAEHGPTTTEVGVFAGYAEDCIAGADSFGGRNSAADGIQANCKLTGTLVRCISDGSTRPINAQGATIRDSRIKVSTTGQHGIMLLDSNTQITGSEILVFQGGTGIPINAGSALNVVAAANRMNNASNDADGLGANVTNLVSSAGNVVSNSIR